MAEKWQDERLFPVCSPYFLEKSTRLHSLLICLRYRLIHDTSMPAESGFLGWGDWFTEKLNTPASVKGLRINDSAAALQAAIDGQGVALARSVMVQADLAAGRLVRLFPELSCISGLGYYLVYRPEQASQKKLEAFKHWMNQNIIA